MKYFFKPDKVFQIDGIGAAISALLLMLVIAQFEFFFGFPVNVAKWLSVLPFAYSVFSLTCHWCKPKSSIYLKIIVAANILYCIITIGLVVYFFNKITIFGILYFLIEKMIVIPLAFWEWKLASFQPSLK